MPEYGTQEQLRVDDVPAPEIEPDEMLIRVVAAGVNPVDWKVAAGYLDAAMPGRFPLIPGWDVAGVVERTGSEVRDYTEGDEVMGYVRYPEVQWGTYGEYTKARRHMVTRRPAGLGWSEAAGLPLAGLTAYQCLLAVEAGEGSVVVVHAAAGGVGSMAVQTAKAMGASRVIGTASERNFGYLEDLGAEPVTYGPGMIGRIENLLDGDRVTAALDLFGGGAVRDFLDLVPDPHGIVSIADPEAPQLGAQYVFVEPDSGHLETLGRMVDDGLLRVEVSRTLPLEDAAEAWVESRNGRTRGKIVLEVARP